MPSSAHDRALRESGVLDERYLVEDARVGKILERINELMTNDFEAMSDSARSAAPISRRQPDSAPSRLRPQARWFANSVCNSPSRTKCWRTLPKCMRPHSPTD